MAEKTRYSDEELEEFRQIILGKLEKAQRDYDDMKRSMMNRTVTMLMIHLLHTRLWKRGRQLFCVRKQKDWRRDS